MNPRYINTWTQLKLGNHEALLDLYSQHYLGLINYGIKLTGDRELTNDCIAQVLLRLWEKRYDLPTVENCRSYLLTCLRRELFEVLKSEDKRVAHYLNLKRVCNQYEQSYEEYLIQSQENKSTRANLTRAFARLSNREIELVRMKFFENLSYNAISVKCGITKRTAYNIIHGALKSLKKELKKSANHRILQLQ
jgi:RNA polymerase sigma factor (sigma-70 family)